MNVLVASVSRLSRLKGEPSKRVTVPPASCDQQDASAGIPGIQIELPVAVVAAGGNVGQIQRGRTGAAYAMGAQSELMIEVNVGILVALEAGKTGAQNGFRRGGGLWKRGSAGRSVSRRSLGSGEKLVAGGIVENAGNSWPSISSPMETQKTG